MQNIFGYGGGRAAAAGADGEDELERLEMEAMKASGSMASGSAGPGGSGTAAPGAMSAALGGTMSMGCGTGCGMPGAMAGGGMGAALPSGVPMPCGMLPGAVAGGCMGTGAGPMTAMSLGGAMGGFQGACGMRPMMTGMPTAGMMPMVGMMPGMMGMMGMGGVVPSMMGGMVAPGGLACLGGIVGGGHEDPEDDEDRKATKEEVEVFLAKGKADERSMRNFRAEPPDIQASVIDRGPLSECLNPSAALMGRIRDAKLTKKARAGEAFGPQTCADWRMGRCDRGDRCRYRHGGDERVCPSFAAAREAPGRPRSRSPRWGTGISLV